MVGRDASSGEGATPRGVGNNGVMSGDKAGGEDTGEMVGRYAGEAEMAEICDRTCEE